MNTLFDQFEHVVDSHHGIYSAQVFAEKFNETRIEGISKEDWTILLAGPDHEDYFQVWADCLDNITVDYEGKRWLVWENEGIYLYPEEIHDLIDWDELA